MPVSGKSKKKSSTNLIRKDNDSVYIELKDIGTDKNLDSVEVKDLTSLVVIADYSKATKELVGIEIFGLHEAIRKNADGAFKSKRPTGKIQRISL